MHFPAHTIDTAPAESRPAMRAAAEKFGSLPPAVARLATSPRLLNGFLTASAGFDHASLPAAAREVVIMTVAVRNGCQVCIRIHSGALGSLERSDLIDPLVADRPLEDEDLEAVRTFTHHLLHTAGAVDPHELDRFLTAGHTPQQALEIVLGIGAYTMSTLANRLVGA